MAGTYKTPGVYVEEISTFPPSVAEVETAIPAFIGYTQKARRSRDGDLLRAPTKIYSLKDFEQLYGVAYTDAIAVSVTTTGPSPEITSYSYKPNAPAAEPHPELPSYLLYFAVKMFFDNGGGQCYIVSVGTYDSANPVVSLGASGLNPSGLLGGLAAVSLEDEPTLLVVPDALKLTRGDYGSLVQAMLLQCNTLGDRFAIFDLYDGDQDLDLTHDHDNDPATPAQTFLLSDRGYFGNNYLKYGAAYYPFVKTSLAHYYVEDTATDNVDVAVNGAAAVKLHVLNDGAVQATYNTAAYNAVKAVLKERYVVMPPSGAVAGVYAATDANRGVWKAPANVSLADVLEPSVRIDDTKQGGLNVDSTAGKSINVLRSFAGKGTLVWGSRTLAGNDNEWRYVPVRRFYNMVEESVKKSTSWVVFEPNDANTWVKVRGMIENYLMQKWREGALAGATPKDAFFVRCGLGTTMNAVDILEGRMIVEIGMAVVRPAEFIILRFSHKLQTS